MEKVEKSCICGPPCPHLVSGGDLPGWKCGFEAFCSFQRPSIPVWVIEIRDPENLLPGGMMAFPPPKVSVVQPEEPPPLSLKQAKLNDLIFRARKDLRKWMATGNPGYTEDGATFVTNAYAKLCDAIDIIFTMGPSTADPAPSPHEIDSSGPGGDSNGGQK